MQPDWQLLAISLARTQLCHGILVHSFISLAALTQAVTPTVKYRDNSAIVLATQAQQQHLDRSQTVASLEADSAARKVDSAALQEAVEAAIKVALSQPAPVSQILSQQLTAIETKVSAMEGSTLSAGENLPTHHR